MSTHNIGFYEELTKNILQLLSNTVLICSPADSDNFSAQQYQLHAFMKQWVQKIPRLHFFVFKSIKKFCQNVMIISILIILIEVQMYPDSI